MATFRDWTTIWCLASARTRAIAVLLAFGTIQAGFAIMFLHIGFRGRGEWTAANLRGAWVMGSIGLLSFFTGVFLAASKIARTSPTANDRNRRMKALARTACWYALVGPFDILLHSVADLPALHHVILIAGGFGLLHLTVKLSLLLEDTSHA